MNPPTLRKRATDIAIAICHSRLAWEAVFNTLYSFPTGTAVSAAAIDHRDHSGLDHEMGQLETIAHAELLKNIVEMGFDGALGYRKPLGDFDIFHSRTNVAHDLGFARRQFLAA